LPNHPTVEDIRLLDEGRDVDPRSRAALMDHAREGRLPLTAESPDGVPELEI
jgi:hypothetical protein